MPTPRAKFVSNAKEKNIIATLMESDQSIESPWMHPNVPLLIFADNILPTPPLAFHGGAIGTGLPVELEFWGTWWLTPAGSARRAMIEARTQALLASDYFSQLKQYGIDAPHWRGSLVVTRPDAPTAFNSNGDQKAVPDLINQLISDGVFPNPSSERIAHVVLMPSGFTQTIGANGAHTYNTHTEFLFIHDTFWVAWVRAFGDVAGEDPEDVIRTMSHELVEMFTDADTDAWYNLQVTPTSTTTIEAGDAAVSGSVKQAAWVNGAHVQAYYSNQHAATVIPIDRDYAARLRGVVHETGTAVIEQGSFRPDPADVALCKIIPACCLPDRDFTYRVVGHDEVIRLQVETQRYRQPVFAWSIEGQAISGAGQVTVHTFAERFKGRTSAYEPVDVIITYVASDATLELRALGEKLNFDLTVGGAVTDGSITGNVKTNVIATPAVLVGFAGVTLELDPEYVRDRDACGQALSDRFRGVEPGGLFHQPKPGEPVEIDPGVLAELPAFTRVSQYAAARKVLALSQMAAVVLPPTAARAFARSYAADVPTLANVLQAHKPGRDAPHRRHDHDDD